MENELFETRVVFKILDGEVIAFLLDLEANPVMIMTYMHVGQHGEADVDLAKELKKATEEEYEDLRVELEGIGYRLYLRERIPAHFKKGTIFHRL